MKNPYVTQEEVVADLEKKLKDAKGKLKTLEKYKYPLKATVYIHADDDSMYSTGKELGLSETQLETFYRTGYEVKFVGEVEEDGTFYATEINGTKLPERIEI